MSFRRALKGTSARIRPWVYEHLQAACAGGAALTFASPSPRSALPALSLFPLTPLNNSFLTLLTRHHVSPKPTSPNSPHQLLLTHLNKP